MWSGQARKPCSFWQVPSYKTTRLTALGTRQKRHLWCTAWEFTCQNSWNHSRSKCGIAKSSFSLMMMILMLPITTFSILWLQSDLNKIEFAQTSKFMKVFFSTLCRMQLSTALSTVPSKSNAHLKARYSMDPVSTDSWSQRFLMRVSDLMSTKISRSSKLSRRPEWTRPKMNQLESGLASALPKLWLSSLVVNSVSSPERRALKSNSQFNWSRKKVLTPSKKTWTEFVTAESASQVK